MLPISPAQVNQSAQPQQQPQPRQSPNPFFSADMLSMNMAQQPPAAPTPTGLVPPPLDRHLSFGGFPMDPGAGINGSSPGAIDGSWAGGLSAKDDARRAGIKVDPGAPPPGQMTPGALDGFGAQGAWFVPLGLDAPGSDAAQGIDLSGGGGGVDTFANMFGGSMMSPNQFDALRNSL